jgi:hypothetical protein
VRIILKDISKEEDIGLCNEFRWFRIRESERGNEFSGGGGEHFL